MDTRYGIVGALTPGETRYFHSYGDVADQNQAAGGVPADFDYPEVCPFALGEHDAVLMNVTVVPVGAGGFATTWAWNQPRPAASFINFISTGGPIANAGVVKTNSSARLNPSNYLDPLAN